MTAAVCICDKGGMLFNKRRQSRDKEVIRDIEKLGEHLGGAVFISDFSVKLFSESEMSVISVSDPLESAGDGDIAFVENLSLAPYKDKIDTLIIYKWNRSYPSDFKLDLEPRNEGMELLESIDFAGHSHEKITREIWKKKI